MIRSHKKIVNLSDIYLPPFLYAGFIFFLSSLTLNSLPESEGYDKVAHLLLYTGLGYLVYRMFKKAGRSGPVGYLTALIVTLYGVSDELHQYYVPGRNCDLLDIVFDGLGGVLAAFICGFADRKGMPIWF